ncbi:MAG TPA: DUF3352 domain-containing protein [Candidatus Limnocylindria bacterium]|nr:DUF3352 domain-containing protein [Candidatus Limnocylindria bacterium]
MSTSVNPSTSLRPWRVVTIAVVAALALGIGVTLGSFLLNARSSVLGSAAGYVPASAPFYVEIRIEPSAAQDAALRELLGHFPPIEGLDLERPLVDQMAEHLDEAISAEGAELSWSEDIDPWFDGRIAIAVLDVPMDPASTTGAPPTVVMAGVSDSAAAEASITRLLAQPDAPAFTTVDHAGVVIRTSDEVGDGAFALTDDQLIVGTDTAVVATAIDTHAAGGASLAAVDERAPESPSLPADWLAFVSYDMTDLMARALEAAETEDPGSAAFLGNLLEHQSLRGAMALSAAGDRMALDAISSAPTGPFEVTNADRGLADEVPGDALYYSEAGDIGWSMGAVIAQIKEVAAQTPEGQEALGTAESALGAELEELVEWIGDGAVSIGWADGAVYGGMVLVPTDVDVAQRRLDQLATFAGLAMLDPSMGIAVAEEEINGTTVTTIRWEAPADAGMEMLGVPSGLAVQYAIADDRVLVGVGEDFVPRALGLDPADSLASSQRFSDAVAEMGGPKSASIVWLDLAGTAAAFEEVAGPMMGDEVGPWLAPLDQVISVSLRDGDLLIQRAALLVD